MVMLPWSAHCALSQGLLTSLVKVVREQAAVIARPDLGYGVMKNPGTIDEGAPRGTCLSAQSDRDEH